MENTDSYIGDFPIQKEISYCNLGLLQPISYVVIFVLRIGSRYLAFPRHVSDNSCFGQWSQRELFSSTVLQSRGLEDLGPEVLQKTLPEACYRRGVQSDWSSAASGCWASRWRPLDGHCGTSKARSNWRCLCTLEPWRGRSCHLGQSEIWWRQLCGPGSAEERATGEQHNSCICCDSGRWLCGVMGPSRLWWRQLCSPGSAQERPRGSGHQQGICRNLGKGSVVTWGNPDFGGDSSAVQDQLKESVQQIQAKNFAFAAILGDGAVISWGYPGLGGDSSAVQDQLRSVKQIQASAGAFSAILEDGFVTTWGLPSSGGDSSSVQDRMRSVKQIQATSSAFAAILQDGSVVTWGHLYYGGDSVAVQHQLRSVQQIQATRSAFSAILEDGSIVTWGDPSSGGDSSAVQDKLGSAQKIQATCAAFAAILEDGSVVT